jgi:GTP-binding protein Era
MDKTKAGFVAILGKPNAGKSTLLNSLLGQKLSITNKKPQTTRKQILGILSEQNYQIIFLDTPGILEPAYLLQEKMMEAVNRSISDSDIILFILDINDDPEGNKTFKDDFIFKAVIKSRKPKILVLNKVDLISQDKVAALVSKFENSGSFNTIIPVSALVGFNIQSITETILENLPENPKYYPDDIVADENERFFVSEIIREKILELYKEEIPYSCEVLIADFKERDDKKNFIQAEIVVEKESQKGIIIGKQGTAIKKLGQVSREAIEEFLQHEVFLELRVKVRSKWRSDERMLKNFGYSPDKD